MKNASSVQNHSIIQPSKKNNAWRIQENHELRQWCGNMDNALFAKIYQLRYTGYLE